MGINMVTISVCMIVKNEEDKLRRCLDSLKDIADEIVIVDTGSTDNTKKIASEYTDKIHDFAWTGSFSDARNYAFSLAKSDYIYSADADEELDSENIEKFKVLKAVLDTNIDIVQMYYCNQLENNTIYSFDRELRPKLYKRLRTFVWEESIHEAVRLNPLIFDSDIDIIHNPGPGHAKRDLAAFEKQIESEIGLSDRLAEIYAKELYIAGDKDNYIKAREFFEDMCEQVELDKDSFVRALTMAAKCNREAGNTAGFMKYALRAAAGEMLGSELCYELGMYYEELGDKLEACIWYQNALTETECYLDIQCQERYAKEKLERLTGK